MVKSNLAFSDKMLHHLPAHFPLRPLKSPILGLPFMLPFLSWTYNFSVLGLNRLLKKVKNDQSQTTTVCANVVCKRSSVKDKCEERAFWLRCSFEQETLWNRLCERNFLTGH